MPTWQYDPALVRVLIVAPPVVLQIDDGFAPGTFVTLSRDRPQWTKHVGIDGQVARTKGYTSGRVSMSFEIGSRNNMKLSALQLADASRSMGIATIVVHDRNGLSLGFATRAWLIGPPDLARGGEAAAIDWLWDADHVEIGHGGLKPVDGSILEGIGVEALRDGLPIPGTP